MALRKVRSSDPEINAIQDAVDTELRRLDRAPFNVQGVYLDYADGAAAGTLKLVHGLGRVARGWLVTYFRRSSGATAAPSIYHRIGGQNDETTLEVYVSHSWERLSFWVF